MDRHVQYIENFRDQCFSLNFISYFLNRLCLMATDLSFVNANLFKSSHLCCFHVYFVHSKALSLVCRSRGMHMYPTHTVVHFTIVTSF